MDNNEILFFKDIEKLIKEILEDNVYANYLYSIFENYLNLYSNYERDFIDSMLGNDSTLRIKKHNEEMQLQKNKFLITLLFLIIYEGEKE